MPDPTQPSKPDAYYQGVNRDLLEAVPATAMAVLEVGCAEGNLGALLKAREPRRRVYGAEFMPDAAARASERLDRVFRVDVEADELELPPGSLDCITYGDVLEHLRYPERVLARHRKLLGAGGRIVCSVPNVQHHSILAALARGDFQYVESGLLDATHLRFFTCSTFIKLLLDAGYAPHLDARLESRASRDSLLALAPLLERWGAEPVLATKNLDTFQFIFSGTPLAGEIARDLDAPTEPEPPLSFVVLERDESRLGANLLASPCLAPGSPHELIRVRHARTAAEGLNRGLAQARHPHVVLVREDVYLPRWWTRQLSRELSRLEEQGGYGVAGISGTQQRGGQARRVGRVVERDQLIDTPLPAQVDTLDDSLLILPRHTPLRVESTLGSHFIGAELCLQARQRGLRSVVVDALCHHNAISDDEQTPALYESGRALARKWRDQLPISTASGTITASWTTAAGAAAAFARARARGLLAERRARRSR